MPISSAFLIVLLKTFCASTACLLLVLLTVRSFSKPSLVSDILSSIYLCVDVGLGFQMADVTGLGSSGIVWSLKTVMFEAASALLTFLAPSKKTKRELSLRLKGVIPVSKGVSVVIGVECVGSSVMPSSDELPSVLRPSKTELTSLSWSSRLSVVTLNSRTPSIDPWGTPRLTGRGWPQDDPTLSQECCYETHDFSGCSVACK